MSKQFGYDIKGLEDAIAGMMTLTQGFPHIASFAMDNIALTVIERAKSYLYGDEEPDEYWEPLWEDPNNPPPGLGTWTPEWNKESRKYQRNNGEPLFDSGELAESLRIMDKGRRSGTNAWVNVGSDLEYAAIHEYGGNNPLINHEDIPSRPYLFPAIVDVFNDKKYMDELDYAIKRMVKDALSKRTKPKNNSKAKKRKRKK